MPDPTSTRTHRSTGRLILDGQCLISLDGSETLDPGAIPPPPLASARMVEARRDVRSPLRRAVERSLALVLRRDADEQHL